MGLFGGGNRSTSTTEFNQETNSEQTNIQDTEGIAASGIGGNLTIIQTDQNAFGDASRLAQGALDVASGIGSDALSLSLATTDRVSTFGLRSIETVADLAAQNSADTQAFGRAAFSTVEQSLGAVGDAYEGANNSIGDLFRGALSFIGDLQSSAQNQLGSTVTALNTIAREQSKSTDERVAEVSGNAIKYVAIIVGVIALGATAYAVTRK